ncbi:uncharacterized protein VTP21DRAFT_6029 [Calcarisporiella thermophila]|uniref:uncharacterized protein n=1 Tax=Calcarisporiella thermophila TaxID=911321 RepID=UPI003742FA6D
MAAPVSTKHSKELDHTPASNESRIRRHARFADKLIDAPGPNINSLHDFFHNAARRHASKNCFGYRDVIDIIEEEKEITKIVGGEERKEKKTWKYFQLSEYKYVTYTEASQRILRIGCGLRKLGIQAKEPVEIFAQTSMDWMCMALGCFSQNIYISTAYDSLGEDGLSYSLNEVEAVSLFTNADLLKTVARVIPKCESLRVVIYNGKAKQADLDAIGDKVKLVSMDELLKLGEENPVDPVPPAADDLCCIMYTSGSTGNPKGVVLTHRNAVSAMGGIEAHLGKFLQPTDTILAYLPLAHVLEFMLESACIGLGITLGYGTPKTLMDSSVRNCSGDLKAFRPTLLVGVPAVFETIRKGVLTQVHKGSQLVQMAFHGAYWVKSRTMKTGVLSPVTGLMDAVVFSKLKQQTGGRLRLALSGGAPISRETQEFLTVALCPILQGYGMTESCGMCTIMSPETVAYSAVGAPVPCVEIKLVDVEEAGYKASGDPPRGEVWIRGASVCSGYYKNEELTRETITEDGWLKTGDIGEWKPNGYLSIIDRKKNLVKLSHGEYIALERLEAIYKSSVYVINLCVHADPELSRPVALVHPDERRIRDLAEAKGVQEKDFAKLCQHEAIIKEVHGSLLAEGKKAKFRTPELLAAISLCSEEWTQENGMLTAAQKLRRKEIGQHYREELEKMRPAAK